MEIRRIRLAQSGAVHAAQTRALQQIREQVDARSHRAVRDLRVFIDDKSSSVVLAGVTKKYVTKQLVQQGVLEALEDEELVRNLNLNNSPSVINNIEVA